MKIWAIVLLTAAAVCAKHEKYIGWKSYIVQPSTLEQVKALHLLEPTLELDFLSHATTSREGVVLVKPEHQADFIAALAKLEVEYKVHAENIKEKLDYDDFLIERRNREIRARNGRSLPYDNYQTLEAIDAYLDEIAAKYPDTVTLVEPAKSFEGRTIKYLKISTTNFEDDSKPVIFIDGGIHSREWISPPTVTYAIHKLTEDVTDPDLLDNFDWIILPIVNPDGYKYSHDTDRFWRKTRSTDQHTLGFFCPGVDGNRNYDFAWNTAGTSNNPCTEIFAGSKPLSEIETQVVAEIMKTYLPRMTLYLTMHSFGSMILYPWGHDGSLSQQALALHTVGINMAEAIHERALPNFPRYQVGNSALVIQYAAAGAAEDYAHSLGVPLSYTYELPGLSRDMWGFHLDPAYIPQVCEETWAGIIVGARRSRELFG
ncbi:carboxypeptidase B-like [Aricia agestis]|uniref:carboxypeptidase B-like n=1 Tax=Aricia agestis TaxID=91739 RepID=UPI001C204677|nr:carboxypeptidase B-like [Aricia agestis]